MAAYRTSLDVQTLAIESALFLLGSTLLHSAGCVLNDIADRDIDGKVGEYRGRYHGPSLAATDAVAGCFRANEDTASGYGGSTVVECMGPYALVVDLQRFVAPALQ